MLILTVFWGLVDFINERIFIGPFFAIREVLTLLTDF